MNAKNAYQAATVDEKRQMCVLAVQAIAVAPQLTKGIKTPEELAALVNKTAEAIYMATEPEF